MFRLDGVTGRANFSAAIFKIKRRMMLQLRSGRRPSFKWPIPCRAGPWKARNIVIMAEEGFPNINPITDNRSNQLLETRFGRLEKLIFENASFINKLLGSESISVDVTCRYGL